MIKAIESACGSRIPVRINAVLTKQNLNDIEFLLDLADRHGMFVSVTIMDPVPWLSEDEARQIMLSTEMIKDTYRKIREWKVQGRRILHSLASLDYIINYPVPYDRIILRDDKVNAGYYTKPCPWGRAMLCVDANGDFYPCPGLWNTGTFQPMNVVRDGFRAAWDNLTDLPCTACSCMALPEWNKITSLTGIAHGTKLTLAQFLHR